MYDLEYILLTIDDTDNQTMTSNQHKTIIKQSTLPNGYFIIIFTFYNTMVQVSNGGVPKYSAGLSSGGNSGRGWIWRWMFLLPAGQDGHTILFTQIFLGPLTSFNLLTQNLFLFDHLHHGGVAAEPWHLEIKRTTTSACRPSIITECVHAFLRAKGFEVYRLRKLGLGLSVWVKVQYP